MIYFIGDGGHATVIRDLIRARERLDKDFAQIEGTIIAVGDNAARRREAQAHQSPYTCLVHPSATVASSALIGMGTVIMAGAIVQARAVIGAHCILNTGCSIDHDCTLEDFVHVAPGAHLCGGVHVGEGALIGVGVGIEPGVTIPALSIVKRFPYVIEPVPSHATA